MSFIIFLFLFLNALIRANNRLLKWNDEFRLEYSDKKSGPPPKVISNIPVGTNRNGPFYLNSERNFRNLWHTSKWKAPTGRQRTDRQTDRQADRLTYWQIDRQIDRQTETDRQTEWRPVSLSWASHGTLIYTSELILCSAICVHSSMRNNIRIDILTAWQIDRQSDSQTDLLTDWANNQQRKYEKTSSHLATNTGSHKMISRWSAGYLGSKTIAKVFDTPTNTSRR